MEKTNVRAPLILAGLMLMVSCAPSIEVGQLKSINTTESVFYQNVLGGINYYGVSFDGKGPLNQLNPEAYGNGKECYFEFLDNGWFLNWKAYNGRLTECRRGMWAIEDSVLILLNLQISKQETISFDTVQFLPKKYVAKWPLYKVSKDCIITKQKGGLVSSFPKQGYEKPGISNSCKYDFTE